MRFSFRETFSTRDVLKSGFLFRKQPQVEILFSKNIIKAGFFFSILSSRVHSQVGIFFSGNIPHIRNFLRGFILAEIFFSGYISLFGTIYILDYLIRKYPNSGSSHGIILLGLQIVPSYRDNHWIHFIK